MLNWHSLGSVLVPVDLEDPRSDALAVAMTARPKEIHVVYVLPELEPSLMTQVDPMHRQDIAMQSLQDWVAEQQVPDAKLHVHIGAPAQVIPEVAQESGVDLVIMGSHGRSGLSRALMGSVAERVMRFSPCPVLVLNAGATPHK